MYNPKDINFVGSHDYDYEKSLEMSIGGWNETFSVSIFRWELKNNGKSMKKGKSVVRVYGRCNDRDKVFEMAEKVVELLDANKWDGRKTVNVK